MKGDVGKSCHRKDGKQMKICFVVKFSSSFKTSRNYFIQHHSVWYCSQGCWNQRALCTPIVVWNGKFYYFLDTYHKNHFPFVYIRTPEHLLSEWHGNKWKWMSGAPIEIGSGCQEWSPLQESSLFEHQNISYLKLDRLSIVWHHTLAKKWGGLRPPSFGVPGSYTKCVENETVANIDTRFFIRGLAPRNVVRGRALENALLQNGMTGSFTLFHRNVKIWKEKGKGKTYFSLSDYVYIHRW